MPSDSSEEELTPLLDLENNPTGEIATRRHLRRKASEGKNYKETKTYNKNQNKIDLNSVDITIKSNKTPRTPPTDRKIFDKKDFSEQFADSEEEETFEKDIAEGHQSTPTNKTELASEITIIQNNFETSDKDTSESENVTSAKIDKNSHLEISLKQSTSVLKNSTLENFEPLSKGNHSEMAPMSSETHKCLKKCPNISSDDSRNDIRENVEKLRMLGKQIPSDDVQQFIQAIAPNFDCEIRDAIRNEDKLETIDQICDYIIQKYVLKGNFNQKFKELGELKKKRSETYADFGKRIVKFKNDLIKLAGYKKESTSLEGRTVVIEELALTTYIKSLRKYLSLVYKFGTPKNVTEAQKFVESAENEISFSDDEEEDAEKPNKAINSFTPRKGAIDPNCQRCSKQGHESFFCPITACLYCKSNLHKSAECDAVAREVKIAVICKECKQANHTINKCEKKNDNEIYCEICQAANIHTANSCDLAAKLSQETDLVDAMNTWMTMSPASPAQQFRNFNQGCYVCGDFRHLARQCPRGHNQPQRGFARGHGNPFRGRGNFNASPQNNLNRQLPPQQGYQNNYNPNYNGQNNYGQNFNGRTFHRGGGFRRGNFNGRGRGYTRNYGNFQNYGHPQSYNGQNYPFSYPQMSLGQNYNWSQMPWAQQNVGEQPRSSGVKEEQIPAITHTQGDNSGNEIPPLI